MYVRTALAMRRVERVADPRTDPRRIARATVAVPRHMGP